MNPIDPRTTWPAFTRDELPRVPSLTPRAVLAVIGDPVAHSRSPQMHNPALEARGIVGQYIRIHSRPDEFEDTVRWCREAGFAGVNCTIPHKLAALAIADDVDPLARRLGAVNTLAFRGGGIVGFNTDGPGLLRALAEELHVDVRGLRVLVLGAGGGAGRAAAIQCALAGCAHLTLINRTLEKIERLAGELGELLPADRIVLESDPDIRDVDLVINASSVGMKAGDPEVVRQSAFRPHHRVYDMIYAPAETPLVAAARAAGATAANGLSMLLHQGAASFEHWFGAPVPLEAMRRGLLDSFND